ncbi:hypothetical protein [Flavisolibacter tropicus]|uniref:hypothetical protein n=1 Tax=Flavisolibacter tropicus TaxID=1492898 RepID=UPI0013146032|nr:hypothetical protein [Flavisolibacter tropicus]
MAQRFEPQGHREHKGTQRKSFAQGKGEQEKNNEQATRNDEGRREGMVNAQRSILNYQ